jgi:hypothetical protein
MWNLAADTMYAYLAETIANTLFEPMTPMTPIVIPGVGEGVLGAALGQAAASALGAVAREAAFTHVLGQSTIESAGLQAGRGVDLGNMAATDAEGGLGPAGDVAEAIEDDPAEQDLQLVKQVGSQMLKVPEQVGKMLGSPMQQLTQPLQQMSSFFGSVGGSMGFNDHAQIGFLGTSPLSNHPLTGGSGASSGAGLTRAAALPGMGGSAPRTPLMAKLIDKVEEVEAAAVEPVGAAAGKSARAGAAPVGSSGGAGPMGMPGRSAGSGGTKGGLKAPAPLIQDLGEDEGDDW